MLEDNLWRGWALTLLYDYSQRSISCGQSIAAFSHDLATTYRESHSSECTQAPCMCGSSLTVQWRVSTHRWHSLGCHGDAIHGDPGCVGFPASSHHPGRCARVRHLWP